jgi:hypothetical protein
MRKMLANMQSRARLKRGRLLQKKQFKNWDTIGTVALVLHANEGISKNELDIFLNKLNKPVQVFFVDPKAKMPAYADWQCIIAQDMNLLHIPKTVCLQKLHQLTFDLVINAGAPQDLDIQNVAAALQANFKCGTYDNLADTNLVITRGNQQALSAYLKEVVKYLQMIKN